MALTDLKETNLAYLIHGQGQRPWGYEVQIAVFDKTQPLVDKKDPDFEFGYRHLAGLTAKFKEEPTEKHLNADVMRRLTNFNAKLSEPVEEPEKEYMESEVVDILVSKGYLVEGQDLADLSVKEVSK